MLFQQFRNHNFKQKLKQTLKTINSVTTENVASAINNNL